MSEANLGLATTEELILELAARVNIARVLGEQWPQYKTSGEPYKSVVSLSQDLKIGDKVQLEAHGEFDPTDKRMARAEVVSSSQAHDHVYPDEWDYTFSPAGSKTCKILGCSQKVYD